MTTGNNTSLGKRRGQSLVDIFKRPFSRKSMTPPASPGSQSKSNQIAKDDIASTKVEEVVSALQVPQESVTEVEESAPAQPTPPTSTTDNGQIPEVFPLPLPPTPNVSPIAAVSTA